MLRISNQVRAENRVAGAGSSSSGQVATPSETSQSDVGGCGVQPDITPTPTASVSSTAGVCASGGNLGGAPPVVTQDNSARPFSVNGSTFLNKSAACGRACDIQHKYFPYRISN
jgi:hypothetical protein